MIIPIKDENQGKRFPGIIVAMLLVNVLMFLYAYLLGKTGFQVFIQRLGLIPFEIVNVSDAISPTPIPLYLTFFTAMFLHGSWLHLVWNMLYFWIFGQKIEASLGHFRFFFYYLFWGLLATLAHVVSAINSTVPLVGSSGAIAGVMGAYLSAFPNVRIHVLVFYFVFRVPSLIVLGVWFVVQLYQASVGLWEDGGVAWYAHIVGFISGYLLMHIWSRSKIKEG